VGRKGDIYSLVVTMIMQGYAPFGRMRCNHFVETPQFTGLQKQLNLILCMVLTPRESSRRLVSREHASGPSSRRVAYLIRYMGHRNAAHKYPYARFKRVLRV
jgi:hypothetical protein